ncbi:MAG: hypothetical protein J0M24_01225 [Verrucomicrobia bacterium]|nr:hypothetical protein [Verrucomicrobiota bacterium]
MKLLIVVFLPIPLLVISCTSRSTAPVGVEPLPPSGAAPVESVRHGEVIRAYHLGRYVDPSQSGVMHEQHPVYRVEAESRWYLLPGQDRPGTGVALNPLLDPAHSPAPSNDPIVAELNRQKDATERVMKEAARLAQSYDQLQKVIGDMMAVAQSHTRTTTRISQTEHRLTQMEQELARLMSSVPGITNGVPPTPFFDPAQP